MKKKCMISFLLASTLILSLTACQSGQLNASAPSSSAPAETSATPPADSSVKPGVIVIKAAVTANEEGAHTKGLMKMKEAIEKYTDGAVDFQVYTNSQLGSEREIVEGVGLGTIEVGVVSTGPLPNFVPDFMVLDLPYLIRDKAKAFPLLDGEVGRSMLDQLENIGIRGVNFWDNGFRYITSVKPIINPEDMKGMKIRTMENEVHMETFKELGATPTPMSISEFLTAVQQGTVDGHENVMVSISMNKVYEVNPSISLTEHFYSAAPFLVNKAFYEGLPTDIREAFDKAEKEAMEWERNYCADLDESLMEDMKSKGAQFYEVDKDKWAAATAGVYDVYKDKINPELIEKFRAAA
ncbi:TRAP transporter substrate-binding protein DctP [Marasmitruncus massiliensis]|uniref:TRAP transporter substrate-binding protein DctP n=1 Tax=Marasmitruncus massiliensis TaxID=1944642 RepID=UPI000C7BE38A|nr:TRAP transporter substrate-binding protein DctP [Marasmitruncus massiliensis]